MILPKSQDKETPMAQYAQAIVQSNYSDHYQP
jgi:hypothetical protein